MIYDSVIWKKELKEKTENFRRLIQETDFSADWYFDEEEDGWTASYKFFIEFQKYCFYSAVITRKFIESGRLSDELVGINYPIKYFKKKTDKVFTKENFESIEEEYDTAKALTVSMNLEKICHIFIHSFIFNPKLIDYKVDEELPDDDIENWEIDGISGLYINTDYTKDKEVYYLDLEFIPRLFEAVCTDSVVYYREDRLTGKIIRSRNHPKDMDGLRKK
jgi:hypothetical protein